MKRGEIYYIASNFRECGHEQRGGRPAVIVSADGLNESSGVVEVVYMTTQPKTDAPTHITTHSTLRTSVILCEQVTTVSKNRVGKYYGKLTAAEMVRVDDALAISLGLENYRQEPVKGTPVEAEPDKIVAGIVKCFAKIEAERDVYKRLYEDLLGMHMKGGGRVKLTLKDLLEVCKPDWIEIARTIIDVNKKGIPDDLLLFPVKNITGFDDGLTIELEDGTSPCTCLPTRKGRKE